MKARIMSIWALFAFAGAAGAEQWQIFGTRPMGMGGAFVAVAQGPIAQYWNPAGLVRTTQNVSGVEIPAGATLEATGDLLKNASRIGDMADHLNAIQAAQKSAGAITPQQAADFVKAMSLLADMSKPGQGVLVEANAGVNFKFSRVALSVSNFTTVGADPHIDITNLRLGTAVGSNIGFAAGSGAAALPAAYDAAATELAAALDKLTGADSIYDLFCGAGLCDASITDNATLANALAAHAQSQSISADEVSRAAALITQYADTASPVVAGALTGGSYTANTSNLKLDAASFMEIAAGYAWNLDKWLGGLALGANLKMVNGRLATSTFKFMNDAETGNAFDDMLKDASSTWAPAADLGLLWNINSRYPGIPFRPRLGIVGRNLNNPRFDRPVSVGGKYTLDRQMRLGLALSPANFWTVAADVDLTKNDTAIPEFESRQLALGTEINLINRRAFNIPLRAGMTKNIAERSSRTAYTLGTGLNLLYMRFDVSGVISTDSTTIDDTEIPAKAGVSASFGLLF